ncbi:MAG TPA: hypothetical protein VGH35_11335 [Gaiellaceae bacterium]
MTARGLPWRRPRHEVLALALVAVVACSVVQRINVQDESRTCQIRAFVHARLTIGDCIGQTLDRSRYHGRLYSNEAPGMALLEIPAYEIARPPLPSGWHAEGDLRVWSERLLCSGLCFVLCAFLLGRVAEGLAPGFGAASLVTLSLGTLMSTLAVTNFDHVPAAAIGLAAFVLLWGRSPLAAGLTGGLALLVEYEAAAIVVALAAYAAWLGRHTLARYAVGAVPGVVLLGADDWAAFGAPWHNPLRYSDNVYRAEHAKGLLGIEAPSPHATWLVLAGNRGLLLTSPVLVMAAAGLYLLWRRGFRAEALVCAAVTAAFLLAECGYFDPYGGGSPGPRYFVPALPFLAVGLGPAFARWPRLTSVLAAASVVATTALLLTWGSIWSYPGTVWKQVYDVVVQRGDSLLVADLAKNIVVWAGPSRLQAAALVCGLAAATLALTLARPRRR